MSKYTEDQINEAIEIVQIALGDGELEYYRSSCGEWVTADVVDFGFDCRAKKKPREFWIVGFIDSTRLCEVYSFNPVETDNEKAVYADRIVTKVREVLE